jgi:hypothetical protein
MNPNPLMIDGSAVPTAPEVNVAAAMQSFAAKYEISPQYSAMLPKLAAYASIIIADDSGSMNDFADPDLGINSPTRWQELKQSLQIIIDAHAVYHAPCDVYFINRGYVRNVLSFDQITPYLVNPPSGGTNLVNVLNLIQQNYVGFDMGLPIVLHIITDGHPTNSAGVVSQL